MSESYYPVRTIIYLNIPSFPTEVAKLLHPELKEQPLIIAPPNSDHSKVIAVSPEAKLEGIKKGTPLAVAKKLCRSVKVLPPEPDLYKKINNKLIEYVGKSVELFEKERDGKIYLDFTGFEYLYGPSRDFAHNFQKDIQNKFKLGSSIGLAKNKLVSKIAAKSVSLEQEIYQIQKGQEQKFLSPLSHMLLPVSRRIKERTHHKIGDIFEDLNIHSIQDLRSLTKNHLIVAFKEHAELIYQMARGIDHRPLVRPLQEAAIVEEMQLLEETNSLRQLKAYSFQLLERASFRLRNQNQYAQKLHLSIRYSDYKLVEGQRKFSQPFQLSLAVEKDLFQLLAQIFYRRTNVRHIALELSGLCHQYRQLSFLDQIEGEQKQESNLSLMNQVDDIRKKFGFDIIKTGAPGS